MRPPHAFLLLAFGAAALAAVLGPVAAQDDDEDTGPVRWKKTIIDPKFRAEGVSVADVNQDEMPDILAGNVWYRAPDWKMHEIRPAQEFDGAKAYSNCFLSFADDVDGDSAPDQIVVGFPGAKAVWFRNPGKGAGTWEEFPITESACNETPIYADLDGDESPELVTPFKESQMACYSPGQKPREGWVQTLIGMPDSPGCKKFSHGLGVGDVNGDGWSDVLCKDGFYQAPVNPKATPWKFVPANLGPDCANMHAYDFDGDGDMDIICSSAHGIGVWWYEQRKGADGKPEFLQHVIDDTFSQSHSMVMADIDRNGSPDFVTGKRWWAHGPMGDVNPNDPAVLYWFEFKRVNGKVEWKRHEIDHDSGVGTQFTVANVNKDRRPDVVIANKKGVFLFEQVRGR